MSARIGRASLVVLAILGGLAFAACGEDAPVQVGGGAPGAPPPAAPRASASASSSVAALPPAVLSEGDFSENDSNRDPFHNFARIFAPTVSSAAAPEYTVILDKYSVDELKLVAIVSSTDGARAMFVDPQGKGWVVTRGMHLGKGEIVKIGTGATMSYPLYWRIDQIKPSQSYLDRGPDGQMTYLTKPGEVVLAREDPLHRDQPPTYKPIVLANDEKS